MAGNRTEYCYPYALFPADYLFVYADRHDFYTDRQKIVDLWQNLYDNKNKICKYKAVL